MVMRLFLGVMIILCFLVIYPYFISLWTDNTSGFNVIMGNITDLSGAKTLSDLEASIWGMFPLLFLALGVGGFVWLIVKDRG